MERGVLRIAKVPEGLSDQNCNGNSCRLLWGCTLQRGGSSSPPSLPGGRVVLLLHCHEPTTGTTTTSQVEWPEEEEGSQRVGLHSIKLIKIILLSTNRLLVGGFTASSGSAAGGAALLHGANGKHHNVGRRGTNRGM